MTVYKVFKEIKKNSTIEILTYNQRTGGEMIVFYIQEIEPDKTGFPKTVSGIATGEDAIVHRARLTLNRLAADGNPIGKLELLS